MLMANHLKLKEQKILEKKENNEEALCMLVYLGLFIVYLGYIICKEAFFLFRV